MFLLQRPVFLAVSLGHFILDIFNSAGPVLVTFLSTPLDLTTAQIGFAIGAYQFFSALTQPLFGWMADKVGSRWLGPGSVAWTIFFLTFSIVVADQTKSFTWFMIPFGLASLGSSAFHPLGTKHAAEESIQRAATGTAIFFFFGQAGLAAGPLLSGIILGGVGVTGMYVLSLVGIPMVIFMAFAMKDTFAEKVKKIDADTAVETAKKTVQWGAIALFALLIGLRSWTTIGTVSMLPKMFQDMGWSPSAYGAITGAFWIASAILGVFAGNWADRWGRRQVIFFTLIAGSIALFFLPLNDGWLAFPLALLTGGLLGAAHSILVVIAQSLLPLGKAFASGVTLGYLFGVGAMGAWGIGILAQTWGLNTVVQAGALLTVAAAFLALALPATRETTAAQAEGGVPAS